MQCHSMVALRGRRVTDGKGRTEMEVFATAMEKTTDGWIDVWKLHLQLRSRMH